MGSRAEAMPKKHFFPLLEQRVSESGVLLRDLCRSPHRETIIEFYFHMSCYTGFKNIQNYILLRDASTRRCSFFKNTYYTKQCNFLTMLYSIPQPKIKVCNYIMLFCKQSYWFTELFIPSSFRALVYVPLGLVLWLSLEIHSFGTPFRGFYDATKSSFWIIVS